MSELAARSLNRAQGGVRRPSGVRTVLTYLLLSAIALIMIFPFIWMMTGSLKTEAEIFRYPIKILPDVPMWSNYGDVWTRVPYAQFYLNTAKIAIFSTIGQLITCSLSAYAFAKLEFKGRDMLFLLYLATMMIPGQVTMIPQYTLLKSLGMVNNHLSLIILRLFNPFGVFLLRQFFIGIPDSICESARIDGCRELAIYARIILPLAKPALATLTTFTFLNSWNDFMGPLIYLNSQNLYTLQVGIRYFQQLYGTEYTLIMAATTLSLIPIVALYLCAQKYFIEGIASTGVKG